MYLFLILGIIISVQQICFTVNNIKRRIVLSTKNLSSSQVKHLAEKYGFELIKIIEHIEGVFILKPKKNIREYIKRGKIPNIDDLKYEPMVSRVIDETWKIRDPRGDSIQTLSNQMADNSIINIRDPDFNKQWYLHNTGQISKLTMMDINILPVWNRGFDGRGVTIAILDDGIDYTNPDIYSNYDRVASYDYQDMDEDPIPNSNAQSSHGTQCATIVAGSSNNFCGIGVAYNASIAGIRMLDNKTTDSIESNALNHKMDHIDIYSCNWGPRDDGKRFGGPGPLATKALRIGASKGRNGLGSIYVWSSGNGGIDGDHCNADGYVTNLYTVVIGAISADGQVPLFAETCSSILAVSFSGSKAKETDENVMIHSDIGGQCKHTFQGTSSSASVGTGVIALMLQANPSLTWRDVQHILVETAQIVNPSDNEWARNGAGKWFNPKYGFGRLDALETIHTSYQWKNVDQKQLKCKISYEKKSANYHLYEGGTIMLNLNGSSCHTKKENRQTVDNLSEITKVEQVQLILSLSHECRGRIDLLLISPSGTKSPIMRPRPKDQSSKGLQGWIFKSVHFWGENPLGQWTLVYSDSVDVSPCNTHNRILQKSSPIKKDGSNTRNLLNVTDVSISNPSTKDNSFDTNNYTVNKNLVPNYSAVVATLPFNTTVNETKPVTDDIKKLYDVISNINEISQRILKTQENNTSSDEVEFIPNKRNPQVFVNPTVIQSDAMNNDDSILNKKFQNLDKINSDNNDTKLYERIVLEKVRVSQGTKNHKSLDYKNQTDKSIGNFKTDVIKDDEQIATSYIGDDDDEDNGNEDETMELPNQQKKHIVAPKNYINNQKGAFSKYHLKQFDMSSSLTTKKSTKSHITKRSKLKSPSKKLKHFSSKKRLVGTFESWTLIIYGT